MTMNHQLYIQDIYQLFEAVQKAEIFEDQKTMADAIPLIPISEINAQFFNEKDSPDFDLKKFILTHFQWQAKSDDYVKESENVSITQHIENLWDVLKRKSKEDEGTLMKLPKSYIVPGGRFNEFFYWDSYFVMLGLQVSGRIQMMKNIIDNCKFLIDSVGFVPNGNRTYFLSRSQPPYFSLMLDLFYETVGDERIYTENYETLKNEYQFWMHGSESLENGEAHKRVLKTKKGDILNRYYDNENLPRPESYIMDVEDFKISNNQEFYRNIRAACESGWDFSSRWFENPDDISTIRTLDLAQVDLNCLLWHLEITLAKTANLVGDYNEADFYNNISKQRLSNIQNYFWDEDKGLYKDYNFKTDQLTQSEHIATLYPLFFGLAEQKQAEKLAHNIEKLFLKKGGLITTTYQSGQQWDFPNAWAPYQWIGFVAMNNYELKNIADNIKNAWCTTVEKVYRETQKLMEKYNAADPDTKAGGGEYPNQDGFGWTNGVYMKLKQF